MNITGRVTVKIDGKIVQKKNMVVYTGGKMIANLLKDATKSFGFKKLSFGTDGTAPNKNQTKLLDPDAPEKSTKDITSIAYQKTGADTLIVLTTNISEKEWNRDEPPGGVTYKEAGLFDSEGLMFSRTNISIDKTPATAVQFIWEISFEESTMLGE